jgi:hypothetical protein
MQTSRLPRPVVCVFCGGGPLTEEDIFPVWAAEVVKELHPAKSRGSFTVIREKQSSGVVQRRAPFGSGDLATKARVVCGRCNNGWMSQMESDAKAFVAPMIRGTSLFIPLSPADQRIVAAWLAKIAMLTQYVFVPPFHPQPNDLSHLFGHREPSSGFHIWLGAYRRDDEVSSFWNGHGLGFVASREGMAKMNHGVIFTMLIGHFVAQVFIEPALNEQGRSVTPGERHEAALVRIWPAQSRTAEWPPSFRLAARDVAQLARVGIGQRVYEGDRTRRGRRA